MKISGKFNILAFCMTMLLCTMGCQPDDIVDFGFDGSFSGILRDQNGNIVPGDITSSSLVVRALGDGDQVSTDMRVKGDGTYQNTKLSPKMYKIWIAGPVTLGTDTLFIDFSKEKSVVKDLVVTPFVSINPPAVVGNPTSTSVDINYEIAGNDGKTISKRELYCSTNPYPNTSTGSGPYFETKKVVLNADEGNISVMDLTPQTKYFIRIGAQATGASGFNYSEQITITTQ